LRFFYFGSGEFSGHILEILINNRLIPQAVITRVDRPAGRGRRPRPTPVKRLAEERKLKIIQPPDLGEEAFVGALREADPEVFVLADYGQLLPPALIDLPAGGCVNVHPSLLPRYRGASPVQRALMDGVEVTGVTLMLMEKGLDAGPIIYQQEVEVEEDEDAGSLAAKLALLGGNLLVSCLPDYLSGKITPRPQNDEQATYADPIKEEELIIDWSRRARDIHNQVRALSPRPGAYTYFRGRRLKILRTIPSPEEDGSPPGTALKPGKDLLLVTSGRGVLRIELVQPEGKRKMKAADFLRGYRLEAGERFGVTPNQTAGPRS